MDATANEQSKKPEIIVFAGPNGSGKSTFTELLRPLVDYINADEIKKNLKCDDLTAAQIAEQKREEHLADVCHIYDNSTEQPFRIFKKRKTESFYDVCEDWQLEDISLLTGVKDMEHKNLNKV